MSDVPNEQNLLAIYLCGTELSDETSKVAVMGRMSAQTVLKPSSGWPIGNSPTFKGRFRGILKKELIDERDTEEVLVIELEEAEFYSVVDSSLL